MIMEPRKSLTGSCENSRAAGWLCPSNLRNDADDIVFSPPEDGSFVTLPFQRPSQQNKSAYDIIQEGLTEDASKKATSFASTDFGREKDDHASEYMGMHMHISRAETESSAVKGSLSGILSRAFSPQADYASSQENFDFEEENDQFSAQPGDIPALRKTLNQMLPHLSPQVRKKTPVRKTSEPGTPFEREMALEGNSVKLPGRPMTAMASYSSMLYRPKGGGAVVPKEGGAVVPLQSVRGGHQELESQRTGSEGALSQIGTATAGRKRRQEFRDMNIWAPTSS